MVLEVFPHWQPSHVGFALAVPAIAQIVLAPIFASWADGTGQRQLIAWGLFKTSAIIYILCGVCMMLGGASLGASRSALLLCMLSVAQVLSQTGVPIFWALHNSTQPTSLSGISIASVNSIGNLGGFIGPALLGTLHDASKSVCEGCTAQWGVGVFTLGVCFLGMTWATGGSSVGEQRKQTI